MVLSDLTLLPEPTPSSLALAADVARVLERWEGPGVVVICGNLFVAPVTSPPTARQTILDALDAHAGLKEAMCHFAARPDCRIVVLPGWRDPGIARGPRVRTELVALGLEVVGGVDLLLETAGACAGSLCVRAHRARQPAGQVTTDTTDARPWFNGLGRLEDPTASGRFVTSRTPLSSPRPDLLVGSRCFRRSWRACSDCRWSSWPRSVPGRALGAPPGTRPRLRRDVAGPVARLLSVRRQWLSG